MLQAGGPLNRSATSATPGGPFLQGTAGISRGMGDGVTGSHLQTQMQEYLHSELYTMYTCNAMWQSEIPAE